MTTAHRSSTDTHRGKIEMNNRRSTKQLVLRVFLLAEAWLFCMNYFFSSQGLYALRHITAKQLCIQVECKALEDHLAQLRSQLILIASDDYFQEKIAREQLQMAYPQEKIYIHTY